MAGNVGDKTQYEVLVVQSDRIRTAVGAEVSVKPMFNV